MKKSAVFAAAFLALTGWAGAQQQLDLSTIKCSDFVSSDKQTIALILMWLEGYYSAEDAKPIVDFDEMEKNGGKLGEYCGKNPGHSLITAADDVMGK